MVSHGDENACERVALGQVNSCHLVDEALSVVATDATQKVEASADGIFGAEQLNILDDVENATPCINVKERVKAINRQYPAKMGHGPAFSLPVKTRVKKLLDKVNGSDSDIPVPHTPSRKAAASAKLVSKGRMLFQAMPVAAEEVPSELSEHIPCEPVPRATTPPLSTGPSHNDGETIAPLTPRRSRRINKDVGETVAAGSLTPRRSRRLAHAVPPAHLQADAGDETETLGLAPLTPRRSRRLVIGCESPSRRTREPLKHAEASADAPMPSTPSRRGRPKKAEMSVTSDETIQAAGPSIFGRAGTPKEEMSPAKAESMDAGASIHPSPSKTLNIGMEESIDSTVRGFVLKSEENHVDDRSTVSESMGSALVSTDVPDLKSEPSSSELPDIRIEVTSVLEVEPSLGLSSTPLEPVAPELGTCTPVDAVLRAEMETELLVDPDVANEMCNDNATQDKAPCDLPDDGNEALNDDKAESKVSTTSEETQSADDINVGEQLNESQPASLPERESLKRKLDDSDDEEEEEMSSEMPNRPIRGVKKLKTEAGAINILPPPNVTKIVVQLEELESDEEEVEEWDSDTDDEDEFAEAGWLMSVFLRTAKTIGLR